jgi:serine/threonine protein kinase/tetratricopeptide (TPR) repeat protein
MQEQAIFIEALEKEDPAARAAFLDHVCAGDAALRERIERLLQRHAEPDSFLESSATGVYTPAPGLSASTVPGEGPGSVIGPYKLLEQIGEGGMGTVFMAEQQEPIRRRVALKVLKPGMDSKQVIARFEVERQALALMDHPNIARVLDAGTTEVGRPYFVMELVKGVAITDYADHSQLTPRQRLELFIAVSQAVQHAHQKGIIHRDLKPSNVLVTLHDGTPVVKVIDFGIAKALGQQLTDKTLFTGFAQLVGTPLYMSPEQAALSGLDVDTRSDIYSLGVLLYELLTGTTPFDSERLRQVGFDELRRIIREEEPPRPSTRISTLGQAATTVSAQRGSDPKNLSRLFRGELDWIVMKALEKDRTRRYETASAFAADVQRHLHNEPVQACPPSALYRFRKFARRNKVAMITVGLVSATLVLGTIVSAYFGVQANERAVVAVAEKTRAQKNLRGLLEALDLFTELDEKQLALEPRQEPIRAELMTRVLAYYERFLRENAEEPSMRRETGMAYRRAGELRDRLGEHAKAERDFNQGIDLLEKLAREFPQEPAYRKELASTLFSRNRLLGRLGRLPEAEKDIRRSVALLERLAPDHPGEPEYRYELASSYNSLGVLLTNSGRYKAAEEAYREALKLGARLPAEAKYRKSTAVCLGNLADLLSHTRRIKEAEQALRAALAAGERVLQESKQERHFQTVVAGMHNNLAALLLETSRPDQAEKEFGRALKLSRKLLDDFPSVPRYRFEVAFQQHNLAAFWLTTGKLTRAGQLLVETGGLLRKLAAEYPTVPDYSDLLARTLNSLAVLSLEQSKLAQARAFVEEAITHQELALVINPKNTKYRTSLGGQYLNLAGILGDLKVPAAEADSAYRRAADHAKQLAADYPNVPDHQSTVGGTLNNWAIWLERQGQLERAQQLLRAAITWQEKAIRANPKNPLYREFLGNHHSELASVLRRLKSPEEEQALRQAIRQHRALPAVLKTPRGQSRLGANLNDLAVCLTKRGEWEEARRLLDEAVTYQRRALESAPGNRGYRSFLRNHYKNLAKTLIRLGQRDQAAEALRQAVAIGEALFKEFPGEREFRANLAEDYGWLSGRTLDGTTTPAEKEKALCRGVALSQELVDESPEDAGMHRDLATVQYNLAVFLGMRGDLEHARPLLEKSVVHMRAACGAQPQEDRGRLLTHYRTLIDALLKLRDHAAAAKHAQEMVPVLGRGWKAPYEAAGCLQRCLSLAANDTRLDAAQRKQLTDRYAHQIWAHLAETAKRGPDSPEVLGGLVLFLTTCPDPKYRDAARAVELAGKAVKQEPAKGAYWGVLGVAHYRAGNWKEAIAAGEKARTLGGTRKETLFFLAMAYWKQGEKKLAQERYDEALAWMKQSGTDLPWVREFRDEAAQVMGLKKD